MSNLISRCGPAILKILAVAGISIFAAYFVISFTSSFGGGRQYEYSGPLAAMWTGIGSMWYSISFLSWWALSRKLVTRNAETRDGLLTLYIWTIYGVFFAVEGFVALIGWAQAENEAAASGLSVLWVLVGGVATSMTVGFVRVKRSVSTKHDETPSSPSEADLENGFTDEGEVPIKDRSWCYRCCCCFCTKRFWVDFSFLFLTTILFLFSTGFMIQATSSASDNANMSPPGEIYSFPITLNDDSTIDVQMHLYCFGEKNNNNTTDTSRTTVIFEHGGGANSLTMLALGQKVESAYLARVCVYDRLGYGYTPTYFTSSKDKRLPNSGVLLSKLLDVAGEEGPYVCAGHSAGGEACLWFAFEQQQQKKGNVTGIAMMDGYPDIIRAGSVRPGIPPEGNGPLLAIQAFAVLVGGTGLTRGLVGNMGPNFVPSNQREAVISLYGQARFWFAQYWDVRSDIMETDESSRLYQQLNGRIDGETGIVTYGGTLSGTKVLVLPAESTVADIDCARKDKGSFCCGDAKDSNLCKDQELDRSIFRSQNDLYAETLSNDTSGLVIKGPAGSEHGFVNHKDYYEWIATQIGEQLLLD